MKRSLMLIESPNKIETISKFLKGSNIKIRSTVGHIRDLDNRSFNGLGFNEQNYDEIKWKIIEKKHKGKVIDVVKEINEEASKCQEIYLSTDPDREGEAISWHIQSLLDEKNRKKCKRVVFNEITKSAIKAALDNPRDLDQNQIKSYLARRLLDRKIGFNLTSFTNKAVGGGSAGRVQSIALKFLKDRYLEIQQFVPEHWFNLKVILENDLEITLRQLSKDVAVDLHETLNNGLINFLDEDQAKNFREGLSRKYKLISIEDPRKERQSSPRAFKTSTLLSTAINRLHMSSSFVKSTAQKLYEGVEIDGESVSLITYPRTDRDDLSETFISEAKSFVEKHYSLKYWKGASKELGKSKKVDSKNLVQGAHEGIRPTYIEIIPNSLKGKIEKHEFELYSLIWVRALSSLMADALYENILYKFDNNKNIFTANSRLEIFDGYKKLIREYLENSLENSELFPLMNVFESYEEKNSEVKKVDKRPPALYTESSLITALEEKGIGRPSTYDVILNTVVTRNYAIKESGKLNITEHGLEVSNILEKFFSTVMHYDYTKNMEDRLDDISKNKYDWKKFLDEIFEQFTRELKLAEELGNLVGRKCECGKELVFKYSLKTKKRFVGCSGYPECKYIESLSSEEKKESEKLDELCPKCKHHLVKRKNKYNKFFLGCSDYPKCKYIKGDSENKTIELVDRECPKCKHHLVKRKNKYNKFFLGCSDYPKCKYIELSIDKEDMVFLDESCPECNNVLIKVPGRWGKSYIRCSDYLKCKYSRSIKNG